MISVISVTQELSNGLKVIQKKLIMCHQRLYDVSRLEGRLRSFIEIREFARDKGT